MALPVHLLPTPAGLVLAAVAVAFGAPIFSGGLRALRLRRQLRSLRREPLTGSTDGFVHVAGRVELESPLFAPLSGRACAGYRLEVEAEGRSLRRHVEVRRAFRVAEGGVSARVPAAAGRWDLQPSASRRVLPGDGVSENLAALLGRIPEVVWLRRLGTTLVVTERSLFAGAECHVVGVARSAATLSFVEEVELERTGTDDVVVIAAAEGVDLDPLARSAGAAGREPVVAFSSGEHLDFLLVSDREPAADRLRVSSIREVGVVLGPLLTLAGLFYLAALADALRGAGRM